MIAVVTGTISPDQGMGQLCVRDVEERLQQYRDGLQYLIASEAFSKIVFCENSNYGIEKIEDLVLEAEKRKICLELLSFSGDARKAAYHGKGYGEGEIMKYVLENSRLMQDEDSFVKMTGRLKTVNIAKIAARLKEDRTYFNVPNGTRKDVYDTRIYAMPKDQFCRFFGDSYRKVRDAEGVFLEHVYTDVIRKQGIKVFNFPRYPRIVGISGSTGTQYVYTEWKCKIKDILSFFGFYKVETK